MTAPQHRATGKARKVELGGQVVAGTVGSAFGAAKLRDSHREQYPAQHTRRVKQVVRVARARGATPQQAARVARVLSDAHVKPGFKSLVTVAGAGAIATGAHRAQEVQAALERRRQSIGKSQPGARRARGRAIATTSMPGKHAVLTYMPKHAAPRPKVERVKTVLLVHGPRAYKALDSIAEMTKAACCSGDMTGVPRFAHIAGVGKVHVVGYHGDGKFHVIDSHDSARVVHRDKLNFIKRKQSGENTMAKSAFGVEHVGVDEVAKASAFGHRGDKRNTKYAGAAYGGAAVGGAVGRQVATRSIGTKPSDVARLGREAGAMHSDELAGKFVHAMGAANEQPTRTKQVVGGYKAGRQLGRDVMSTMKNVPGGARMIRGGKVGAAAGAATGAAALAASRHHKAKSTVGKSAFGVEHIAKADPNDKPSTGRLLTGTYFGAGHSAVAGRKGAKLKAVGSSLGHGLGGEAVGATTATLLTRGKSPAASLAGAAGGAYAGNARAVVTNSRKGRYKPESQD